VVLPGGGLTPLKVRAEWLLAGAFIGSTAFLLRFRERFSSRVFHRLVAHGIVMAACEICFTLYGHPYDTANFLGHVLLLAGVTLQYQAILRSGLIDPDETTFRDLTQAKERLERAQQALRDADESKNEFLAMVSHELRNPLAPISNSLQVLELAPGDGEAARAARAVIGRQVAQLVRLVDDLLDITRVSRQKLRLSRERIELGELVRRAVEDHRTLFAAAGVGLELRPAEADVHLEADASRLSQVVGNLLQNAVKFTPRGGRVTVAVEAGAEPGRVRIRVCDTGLGMSPEVLASVFQPFVQADATLARSRDGLGLGLALVKGLAELHGGEVQASSRGEGKGSEFVVSLPLEVAGSGRH
jgi:signal transduction histidine kinase